MLKSIKELSQVGKLDEQTIAELQFAKFTVIYGANGSGKSTLAALLHSLAANRPEILLAHQNLAASEPGESVQVRIQSLTSDYVFKDKRWNQAFTQMAVFDSHFINDNIHSGQLIQAEHRRHLFDLILGQEAIQFSAQIDVIDQQIKVLNQELKECDKAAFLRQTIKAEDFVNLPALDAEQLPALELQRQNLFQQLAILKAYRSLPESDKLGAIHPPKLDWQSLYRQCAEDLTDLHQQANTHVQNWLKQLHPQAESWLAQGLQHTPHSASGEALCPFCAQSLAGSELVKLYAEYFNQAYQQQQADLNQSLELLSQLLPDNLLIQWQTQIQSNLQIYQDWSTLGELSPYDALDVADVWQALKLICTRLSEMFKAKQAGIKDLQMEPELEQNWQDVLERLRRYYVHVQQLNKEIHALLNHWQQQEHEKQAQIKDLEAQLNLLEISLFRASPEAALWVQNWQDHQQQKEALDAQKKHLRQQLKDAMGKVFSQCTKRLNKYLYRFKTGLSLIELKELHTGGKASIHYALKHVHGKISLDTPKEPVPYWGTVLSGADQQCLGLSFFLAQAEAQAKQILVFDDPTLGLDRERFGVFCECLEDLQDQLEQIIVFSHQELDFSAFDPLVIHLN